MNSSSSSSPTISTAVAASNLAGWHDACVRSLGAVTRQSEHLWSHDRRVNEIYFSAITLSNGNHNEIQMAEIEQLLTGWQGSTISVCDSFAALDLGALGFSAGWKGTWTMREADSGNRSVVPTEIEVSEVTTAEELAEWEFAEIHGFSGHEPADYVPHFRYGATLVDDPAMRIYAGRIDGRIVGGSSAYVGNSSLGMYSVFTLTEHRRKGYGEALAWAATLSEPTFTATTEPSDSASGIYRRMGYERVSRFRSWSRII